MQVPLFAQEPLKSPGFAPISGVNSTLGLKKSLGSFLASAGGVRRSASGGFEDPPLVLNTLFLSFFLGGAGIYSIAGEVTPVGDFRPASPDSFDDDYDDVSLSDRGHRPPVADEDLQSQKSKGGTGVYILAGKPASPNPSQKGDTEPRGGGGRSRRVTSVAVLYVLVALSFVAWVLLFALAVVKQMEIMEELKLLRTNYSENQANALICRSVLDNKKCSAGWKIFEKSCYSFSTETMSWPDAKESCADQGAHLVTVNSELEQKFLKDNINRSSTYWLGVTDQLEEGIWVWTTGEQTSISYWNTWKENKDRDQKDCGSIGPDGIWTDDRCSHSNHWICEKSWNC
ncbi:hepatic lectin-like isoform X2 [Nyctibius grandis]|uniref:hepatic lectin-like isoform X2 n=1 Tax=Nyctibius grandis TaxID=48427 RepID=UPI0035BC7223